MTPRLLVLMLGLYITLDLSNPLMPGAFSFDTADSVEGLSRETARSGGVTPHLLAVPAPPGIVVQARPVISPRRRSPTVTSAWRATTLRLPPAARDTAPPAFPDH